MNGIRTVSASLSIAEDDLLQIGTDKFGQKQVLLGILPLTGGDLEFIEVTNENWGNRLTQVPDYSDSTSTGGGGYWIPPLFQVIEENAQTTVRARQNSAGNQVEGALLKFMLADSEGNFPARIADHIGELHTQFAEGTATNGNFPGRSTPTATENVLNELTSDTWMPLMGAAIGDTPGRVAFAHPRDEGYPPEVQSVSAVGQGLAMMQNIAPTNPLLGADEMTFLAQDDAAAAVDMYLWTGRITGGMAANSNRLTLAV